MNAKIRHQLNRNQRRVQRRLDKTKPVRGDRPVLSASNIAEDLPENAWQTLQRRQRPEPRKRAPNVKDAIVREHEFETLRLQSEEIAEFPYRPTACQTEPKSAGSWASSSRRSSTR